LPPIGSGCVFWPQKLPPVTQKLRLEGRSFWLTKSRWLRGHATTEASHGQACTSHQSLYSFERPACPCGRGRMGLINAKHSEAPKANSSRSQSIVVAGSAPFPDIAAQDGDLPKSGSLRTFNFSARLKGQIQALVSPEMQNASSFHETASIPSGGGNGAQNVTMVRSPITAASGIRTARLSGSATPPPGWMIY